MSQPRILVTRSEPGASETADRLRAMGFAPIVEPVFGIEPIPAAIPQFDALAFTSANGVREFAKLSSRRDAPVYCVGWRTGTAAREAGFSSVESSSGNVTDLVTLIYTRLPQGARLLHAGNEESRGDLSGQLRARGYDTKFVAIFRAIPVASPGPALARHMGGEAAFEAVLIHSPRGAAILAGLAKGSAAPIDVAAISAAAAAPLASIARRSEVAASPDEQSLLSALSRLVSG